MKKTLLALAAGAAAGRWLYRRYLAPIEPPADVVISFDTAHRMRDAMTRARAAQAAGDDVALRGAMRDYQAAVAEVKFAEPEVEPL